MYEPLNLARSLFSVIWILAFYVLKSTKGKFNGDRLTNLTIYSLIFLPIGYSLSSIFNRQDYRLALLGHHNRNMGILFLLSITFLVLYLYRSELEVRKYINFGLGITFLIILIYGSIQLLKIDPLVWRENDRTTLTLGNSDFAAALLGSIIAMPQFFFFRTKSILLKVFSIIAVFLVVLLGLYSQAFQFRVVAFVSTLVFFLILFKNQILAKARMLLISMTSLAALTALYAVRNWDDLELVSRTNAVDRLQSTLTGIRVFRENIWFGVGIEQFWKFEPKYRGVSQSVRNGPNSVPDKVHNVFIDHFANGGVFVGLSFIVFIAASLFLIYRMSSFSLSIEERSDFALMSSIWVSYVLLLFITTDNVFAMLFAYVPLGLIIKMYIAHLRKIESKVGTSKGEFFKESGKMFAVSKVVASIILFVTLPVGAKAVSNSIEYHEIVLGRISDGNRVLNVIREWPNPKATEEVIVMSMKNLANCPFAVLAANELIKVDSRSAQALYIKALCSDAKGNQVESLKFVKRALIFQPLNEIYWEARIRLELRLEDENAALGSFNRLKSINPGYAGVEDLEKILSLS